MHNILQVKVASAELAQRQLLCCCFCQQYLHFPIWPSSLTAIKAAWAATTAQVLEDFMQCTLLTDQLQAHVSKHQKKVLHTSCAHLSMCHTHTVSHSVH